MLSGLSGISLQPASELFVTSKSASPVCPECQSSLNRVPRRFIDRLLSLVYPVHRYHCRSFMCNWEGNLRYTAALSHWEALGAQSDLQSPRGYRAVAPSAAPESPTDETVRRATASPITETRRREAQSPIDETRRRESDTLPMPHSRLPKSKRPDARAEPRDGTNAPRRARKRAQAAPR
jgi:hypothetical protein